MATEAELREELIEVQRQRDRAIHDLGHVTFQRDYLLRWQAWSKERTAMMATLAGTPAELVQWDQEHREPQRLDIPVRDQLEGLVHSVEQTLGDFGQQLPEVRVAGIQKVIAEAKQSLLDEGRSDGELEAAHDQLASIVHEDEPEPPQAMAARLARFQPTSYIPVQK